MSGVIHIGLSGWSYRDWHDDFYPADLSKHDELWYASRQFPTLEINRTFYSLASGEIFRTWHETTPARFKFAVKGSRFITHNKKLRETAEPLANFMGSGILELKDKLGPILWQLGPRLRFSSERMDRFLSLLPKDSGQVAAMAGVSSPTARGPGENHRVRHVVEPRHESFFVPGMVRLAREHRVALAFSHSSQWPYTEEITSGFVYLRLHGPGALYSSAYSDAELGGWASRIRAWSSGSEPEDARRITDLEPPRRKRRDVYVYFDNDAGGHAPRQARSLTKMVDGR
ncbi:MAG: DUF72 domain-containing protein [Acidimicrobiia bacterium]